MAIISTLDHISIAREAWTTMLGQMRSRVFAPSGAKTIDMQFSMDRSVELLRKSASGLRKAVASHPELAARQKANGRPFYTVADLQRIRDSMGWHPGKSGDEAPAVLTVQNFKGGVGKSTITVHLAHYLGLRGYRVLVIDCDPQASTTALFDIHPDEDLRSEETLAAFLSPDAGTSNLRSVIRSTIWPTIDIVPSNLTLQSVEYELTKESTDRAGFISTITKLGRGILQVASDYDVVLLDPPPALGFLALNALVAANAMIIPAPAKQVDFTSTIRFLEMLEENISILTEAGVEIHYDFFKILCSNYEASRAADVAMWSVMQNCSGTNLLPTPLKHSEEIKHAANSGRSVYELDGPAGAPTTYKSCLANLDLVFGDIELAIRKTWPSHARDLQKLGLVVEQVAA